MDSNLLSDKRYTQNFYTKKYLIGNQVGTTITVSQLAVTMRALKSLYHRFNFEKTRVQPQTNKQGYNHALNLFYHKFCFNRVSSTIHVVVASYLEM